MPSPTHIIVHTYYCYYPDYEREGKILKFYMEQLMFKISHKDVFIPINQGARKDWGYAEDYVEGMWMMLNYKEPDDFVLGTGEIHTVREFTKEAFKVAGIPIRWEGDGINERGVTEEGKRGVRVKKELYRPLEAENFLADYSKAERKLRWKPRTKFAELVKLMVDNDLKR